MYSRMVRDFIPPCPATYQRLTCVQQDNMRALLLLLNNEDNRKKHLEEILELHRELGEFEEAAKALNEYEDIDRSKVSKLLADLVKDREMAPVRYRL